MSFTHAELKKKTVAELREIAKGIEHEAVQGYSQLNKEHLLVALCKALNIDMHEHRQVVALQQCADEWGGRRSAKTRPWGAPILIGREAAVVGGVDLGERRRVCHEVS